MRKKAKVIKKRVHQTIQCRIEQSRDCLADSIDWKWVPFCFSRSIAFASMAFLYRFRCASMCNPRINENCRLNLMRFNVIFCCCCCYNIVCLYDSPTFFDFCTHMRIQNIQHTFMHRNSMCLCLRAIETDCYHFLMANETCSLKICFELAQYIYLLYNNLYFFCSSCALPFWMSVQYTSIYILFGMQQSNNWNGKECIAFIYFPAIL